MTFDPFKPKRTPEAYNESVDHFLKNLIEKASILFNPSLRTYFFTTINCRHLSHDCLPFAVSL